MKAAAVREPLALRGVPNAPVRTGNASATRDRGRARAANKERRDAVRPSGAATGPLPDSRPFRPARLGSRVPPDRAGTAPQATRRNLRCHRSAGAGHREPAPAKLTMTIRYTCHGAGSARPSRSRPSRSAPA
ncbi:hypothetical protein Slala04_77950 [Streptomyces lavendulae subsp. lavendulae]|nr:hypothetical protein Slala04_77950 [Streptomyces lavendulae subsp. lavendulae]